MNQPAYNPFPSDQEPTGAILQGFSEEYDLTVNGNFQWNEEFLPLFQDFLGYYPGQLPPLTQFINSWRHFIGLAYECPQSSAEGAAIEGFRADFDQFFDPPWLAKPDLDLNGPGFPYLKMHTLFWLALQRFFQTFSSTTPLTPALLTRGWHHFLAITAVCHNATALSGEFKNLKVFSYEEVFHHYFPADEFAYHFPPRLRFFCDQMIQEEGYFLPSHHFKRWVKTVEQEYDHFLEAQEADNPEIS